MTNLATIVLVCSALPAVAATSIPPKPPTVRKAAVKKVAAPTQGSGAMLLTAKAAVVPVVYVTNRFFFAATAVDRSGLESDFSTEVSTTNIIKRGSTFAATVTLAWDYTQTNFPGATFKVYRGMASSNYTASFPAGTNHQLSVPLYGPFYTNCVVTASCPAGGTNLQSAKTIKGPWTTLNKTNWQGTNVTGALYFRSMGSRGNAIISRRWQ